MTTAKKLTRFNLYLTLVWLILAIPSLIWWKDSILWVIVISLWANIVGHFSAYIAGRGEVAQQQGTNLTEQDRQWFIKNFQLAPITHTQTDGTTTSRLLVTTETISTVPKKSD